MPLFLKAGKFILIKKFHETESVCASGILLVEQNAFKALEICHRGYVFDIGTIALGGSRESLLKEEQVEKILVGG